MEKKCIGIDIGGTTVKLGIFKTDGSLLEKWEVPTRKEEGGRYILPDVASAILAKLQEMEIAKEDVAGAGMGVPGPVMPDGYVEVCVNLGWKDMNPQQELERLLGGIPVRLEQVASATGIAREARRTMAALDGPSDMRTFGEAITAKDVLDCAKAGDAMANMVMETVGRYLGIALAQVALTVDPEAFVIGGGVSKAGQFLIDVIERYYQQYTTISSKKALLALAKLGNDAGIYGAARLVLD